MCRNIRPLHNYEPASTREDVEAAALATEHAAAVRPERQPGAPATA